MKYSGHAFHHSLPKGKSSGEIDVGEGSIRFQCQSGQVSLPLHGISLQLGGASDRLVFITHASQPEWNVYTADRSILKHPAFSNTPAVQAQVKTIKRRRAFNWSVLTAVLAALVLLPLSLFLFMDGITAGIAQQIPANWEHELGEKAYAQYSYENDILEQEPANKLLGELTQTLLQEVDGSRYKFSIVIANDPELNAFALPGGFMVINSGLILKAGSAAELLGVLAHEIAHVTEQHGVRNVIAASGTFLIVQGMIGDASGVMATLAGAIPLLLNQSYSRGFESDADSKGVALLTRASINPTGLVSFFEKVIEEQEKTLAKIEDEEARALLEGTLDFLSTHPATDERIKNIEALIDQQPLGSFKNLDAIFFELQNHVKQFVSEEEIQ